MKVKAKQSAYRATIDYLIYSNLWVACALGAISLFIIQYNNIDTYHTVITNVALGFLSYNYIYTISIYTSPKQAKSSRGKWIVTHKKDLVVLNLIAFSYTLLKIVELATFQITLLIILSTTTFLYIIPGKFHKGLRSIPGIKIILIACSYTLLAIPFQLHDLINTTSMIMQSIVLFTFIVALGIPFDMKDMENDPISLKTIPQAIGKRWAMRISQLLFVSVGITLFKFSNSAPVQLINSIFIITYIFTVQLSEAKNTLFYSFYLEGIPIIWIASLLIIQ